MELSWQQNNRSPDVTSVYAWLSRDADGIEGIIAWPVAGTIMALADTDEDRALRMERFAREAAKARGFPAVLVKFQRVEAIRSAGP